MGIREEIERILLAGTTPRDELFDLKKTANAIYEHLGRTYIDDGPPERLHEDVWRSLLSRLGLTRDLIEVGVTALSKQDHEQHEFHKSLSSVLRILRDQLDHSFLERRDRPRIVCLCGSTRFYEAFQRANFELTMKGHIVLSVGFYPHAPELWAKRLHGETTGITPEQKIALDELHKRKIELADEVLILNVDGYIGSSTRAEHDHARRLEKKISYLQEPTHFVLPGEHSAFVKEAAFFREQGGEHEPWGVGWVPVIATDIEDARLQAKSQRLRS